MAADQCTNPTNKSTNRKWIEAENRRARTAAATATAPANQTPRHLDM